jgi:Tol biopolymer transport system component
MDVRTLSVQKLSLPAAFREPVWSSEGNRIALVAEDGSLWQVDYPTLENLEQLTPTLPDVHAVNWSPDGDSIAFISGSDIYVVETNK